MKSQSFLVVVSLKGLFQNDLASMIMTSSRNVNCLWALDLQKEDVSGDVSLKMLIQIITE